MCHIINLSIRSGKFPWSWKIAIFKSGSRKLSVVVYVDFDTIGHSALLQKLSNYGREDKELEWFNNYLVNRKNYVCMDRNISRLEPVYCGVPQVLILRPFLFIIFINDLSSYTERASAIMAAADKVLYVSHESKEKLKMIRIKICKICYPTFAKMSLL